MSDLVATNYLHAFLERQTVHKYNKGEIIIFQGEAPRYAYIVKSGTVKSYNISVGGDEKPIAFYSKDFVFPSSWVYGRLPSAVFYYEAFSDTVEVYLVEKAKYLKFIKKSPDLLYQELDHLLADQIGATMRINALQHSRASDKLIYTLHYLALTHGAQDKDGSIIIELNLTHQDFANLTGLTRETAATELNKLKKLGIISYGKHLPYKLYVDKLLKQLNDQFLSEIKISMLQS